MRWHYRDAALLWLFPPAYAVHVVEELVAGEGFPVWVARIVGSPLPLRGFLLLNFVGMVLLLAAVRRAIRDERSGWLAIAVGTIAVARTVLFLPPGTPQRRSFVVSRNSSTAFLRCLPERLRRSLSGDLWPGSLSCSSHSPIAPNGSARWIASPAGWGANACSSSWRMPRPVRCRRSPGSIRKRHTHVSGTGSGPLHCPRQPPRSP